MAIETLSDWARHLHDIADSVWPGHMDVIERFDVPLAAVVCGQAVQTSCPPEARREVKLWWALIDESINVDTIIGRHVGGPLFGQADAEPIEVWTESELCSMHALWNLARLHDRDDWRAQVEVARQWHLEHTQPDNATNRPWALHVFLLGSTSECRFYAETLLHNAQAMRAAIDPVSAVILFDAARRLSMD